MTACGWEIMITCEPSTSVMVAPVRCAIERTRSAPAALSPVATTAQDGKLRQAGGPVVSLNAAAAMGRRTRPVLVLDQGRVQDAVLGGAGRFSQGFAFLRGEGGHEDQLAGAITV